jgi:hypothetical protein
MNPFHWTCPFCAQIAEIGVSQVNDFNWQVRHPKPSSTASRVIEGRAIFCPNPKCQRTAITLSSFTAWASVPSLVKGELIRTWALEPTSKAQSFPDYVPSAIRKDHEDAWLIKEQSPNAAAVLARRALQAMIRDYWKLQKSRLFDEIAELQHLVDCDVWKAIDGVRRVGNLGAHIQGDLESVQNVTLEEAAELVWLIEFLIAEWYVARHERAQRLKHIAALGERRKPTAPGP